jgi:IPT/TIG domain
MTPGRIFRANIVICFLFLFHALAVAQSRDDLQLDRIGPITSVTTPGSTVTLHGTGFMPDALVYFGGFEARQTRFVSSSTLEVVTPYLRPGSYRLQLTSGGRTLLSDLTFNALPAEPDAEIDRAIDLAKHGQTSEALAILTPLAKSNSDRQVRARAHYEAGQIYFAIGDWWRWAGEAAAIFDPEAGLSVQTFWQYRMSYAYSVYLLPVDSEPATALSEAEWVVKYDVTENPEPRFLRSLVNARSGHLEDAKFDANFLLKLEPNNASYRALAAYLDVLMGRDASYKAFEHESINDARALSLLGEAAYLSGNDADAKMWWAEEAKLYPAGASLAFWPGAKHAKRSQDRVASALLAECIIMSPNAKEAKEAGVLLASIGGRLPR